MKKSVSSLILIAWVCAAAGCSFMAPQPDRTQYFILSPTAESGSSSVAAASTSRLSIGVGPIKFPDYLKRPGVVTRAASNRLMVSDVKRWAEPLDHNFESVLCQNLSQTLGTQRIITYPWYANTQVDYQVKVWVSRFETSEDGASQLSAVWTIVNPKDGSELASGQSSASAPVQAGDDGPSAALSRDLGEMSHQIADRIAQIGAMQRPGATLLNAPSQRDHG
jgi:uncharacterized protein